MGDSRNYKSDRRYKDRRRDKRRDDDDDDDDYRRDYKRREEKHKPGMIERILTPGTATNNVIKTAATGIIAGGTILLMGIYGLFGDRLAGASYLPMATAVASAVGTACVWIFGRSKTEETYVDEVNQLNAQLSDMKSEMDELHKRLANVEMIESLERRLAERDIASQLEKARQKENVIQSELPYPLTEESSKLEQEDSVSKSSHMPSQQASE